MKYPIKLLCGALCFMLLAFQPLRANLISAVAMTPGVEGMARINLLEYASTIDPCSDAILDALGNAWYTTPNYVMAARAYGRGVHCSPGSAMMRFKYGESIVSMGYPMGVFSIKDALKLEPNSPVIQSEVTRLMGQR